MLFYNLQSRTQQDKYKEYLQIIGSLSNLFSNSEAPYLYYRVAEKMFCKAFHAQDLSRGDVSYDAKKESLGIGLKTFLRGNNKSIQKIAEFNRDRRLYEGLSPRDKIIKISEEFVKKNKTPVFFVIIPAPINDESNSPYII